MCSTVFQQQVAPKHRLFWTSKPQRGISAQTSAQSLDQRKIFQWKTNKQDRNRAEGPEDSRARKAKTNELHTSTATLKSTIETLVLRCQQTCTVVLPRWPCRSRDERELPSSSSDSNSPPSSDSSENHGIRHRLAKTIENLSRNSEKKSTKDIINIKKLTVVRKASWEQVSVWTEALFSQVDGHPDVLQPALHFWSTAG